jgi:Na+/proline symporter
MRTGVKILLIIGAFMFYGLIQIVLKGGDSSRPGVGGPIGIIFLFVFFAVVRAIWKYNPDEKNANQDDKHNLDKS